MHSLTRTRGFCRIPVTLKKRIDSFSWVWVLLFEFCLCATAIGKKSQSYASSPLGRQIETSNVSIAGGSNEETLRFLQIRQESISS